MDSYFGKYPATIVSYDAASRTCRVKIPGITDGGDVMPKAEICYPIGDKSAAVSNATEIEILAGDPVWIEFVAGDKRFPLIVGWRNPTTGNSTGWRRLHHANLELTADGTLKLNANALEFNAPTVTINGNNTTINGSSLKHNAKSIGDTHAHGGVQTGAGNTAAPI